MKILKPNWVNHSGQDIFSIDVHPDGSRFATGGQGQDSGKIIIWNMGPIVDKEKEHDENSPKILCQMDHHIACVNIVRWSNNGFFLASGSDDKLVMIWQFAQQSGSYQSQNIENWKCGHTLRGHNGDVLDLAWSPNDDYLATCSIDNTIIVWNAHKFPDILQRINAHAGMVKGVTWDPVGEYLASQSEDKTVKIWNTKEWKLVKSIDEPFKQSTGTTHVLRLNWSPDGQYLITAHAVNNGAPTAQIISRNAQWNHDVDFVGHRKAVTVVRFYPQIMKPFESSQNEKSKVYCLLALGSRDRSLSVWQTHCTRPLCVIQDMFDNPILDLSWSKQPAPGLLACSTDGTVAYLQFENSEVGTPLGKSEHHEFFMRKYNHDLKSTQVKEHLIQNNKTTKNETKSSFTFIENYDALVAQEQQKKQQQNQSQARSNPFNSSSIMNENSSNSLLTNRLNILTESQKQIERRLADGRRRITPICVSKPGDYDAPRPFGSAPPAFGSEGFSKSIGFGENTNHSEVSTAPPILIEKRNEKNEVLDVSPVKSVTYNKPATTEQPSVSVSASTSVQRKPTESVSATANASLPPVVNKPAAAPKQIKTTATTAASSQNKPEAKTQASVANKQKIFASHSSTELTTTQPSQPVQPPQPVASITAVVEPSPRKIIHQSAHQTVLPIIRPLKSSFSKVARFDGKEYLLEVHNEPGLAPDLNQMSLVKLSVDKKFIWQIFLFSKVCDLTCNKSFVAVCCEDSTLNLYKLHTGSQICSPVVLDSLVSALHSISNYIMCLTSNCYVYVWQYDRICDSIESENNAPWKLCTIISQLHCHFISHDNQQFSKAFVTENGIPVIQMTCTSSNVMSTRSYYYSIETKCWHVIPFGDEANHLITSSMSLFSNNFSSTGQNDRFGPLELIQSRFKSSKLVQTIETLNRIGNTQANSFSKQDFTLLHLESQINASIGLNSPREYKFWLLTYARYLIENDYEDRLNDLCSSLVGPLYSSNWNQNIMIYKKRDLIKEILPLMATNLKFQRMHSLYKQQLNLINNYNQKSSVLDRLVTSSSNARPPSATLELEMKKTDQLVKPITSNHVKSNLEVLNVEKSNSNSNISSEPILGTKDMETSLKEEEKVEPMAE